VLITILASIAAGVVAVLATIAVERMGGLLGGVLASIPTTIVPAALGFYWSGEAFDEPLLAVPFGMLVNALFLYTWRIFPPRLPFLGFWQRLGSMIMISLGIWAFFALSSVWLQSFYSSFFLSILITVIQVGLGAWACTHNPPAPKGNRRVGWQTLLMRGVLAGCAIGTAVALSHLGALAGIASVFPAIFLTTMVSVWISQGEAVQGGAVGPMMLGSSSVSVFALLVIPLFGVFSPFIAVVLAWFASVFLTSVPSALWLRKMLQQKNLSRD